MAGPAIRALELGKCLSRHFATTVASPVKTDTKPENLPAELNLVTGFSRKELTELALATETIFIQANVLKPYPFLAKLGKYLIVDLYDPYLFSVLVQYKDDPVQASSSYRLMHQILEKHMLAADFTVCASERQRDYWLGRFCALGRINPSLYNFDPSLRKLLDVVPYGLPEAAPCKCAAFPTLRERLKIGENDPVLLWGGGIWDWFDPLTPISAVSKLVSKIPNLRLVFMGTKSPNPKVPVMDMTVRARELSDSLALTDKNVFFLDGWVDYDERVNYLLDADIAISSHFDLPETRFSFRTRILDYFWCGLPILTTHGDGLADLIQENGAGLALPYEDVDAWSAAIEQLVLKKELRQSMKAGSTKLSSRFHWQDNARPILEFLQAPYHLPDYEKVTMPSLLERAHAVYRRGGQELILKRSKELLGDILK